MLNSRTLTRFVAMTAAASLMIAPLASAERGHDKHRGDHHRGYDDDDRREYRDDRREYRDDRREYRDDRREYRDDRREWRDDRYSYYDRHGRSHRYVSPRRHVSVYYGPHYYDGYRARYDVGGYYSYGPRRTVYISDYDRYGLYAPPRGYHWVHDSDNGDAVLASVATGAILGLVIGAIAFDD